MIVWEMALSLPLKTRKFRLKKNGDIVEDRRIGSMQPAGVVMMPFAETAVAKSAASG
jgi:hypothetical protein